MSGPGDATLDDVNPQPAGELILPNKVKMAVLGRILAAGFCLGLDAVVKWAGGTSITNATSKRARARLLVELILVHNITTSVVALAEKLCADPGLGLSEPLGLLTRRFPFRPCHGIERLHRSRLVF